MRVISIVSHGNGAGKTSLLASVGRAWPGRFGAVKFTTVFRDGQNCPRAVRAACACSKLRGRHSVVSEPDVIGQPNTDTGVLVRAGLSPVLWCLARPDAHGEAWPHVQDLLGGVQEILTEGNTATLELPTDEMLFVVNPAMPRERWKPNWRELAARADAIVVNDAPGAVGRWTPASEEERASSMAEVEEAAPQAPRIVARLEEPFAEWAGPYLESLVA